MATVIENETPRIERTVIERDTGDSSAGWVVAVIVLIAIIAFGVYAWTNRAPVAPTNTTPNSTTDINVTLPAVNTGGGADTGTNNGSNLPNNGAAY